MNKQSCYFQGGLSMSSVKQVVIWVEEGTLNCPSYITSSRRRHPRHISTNSFKQVSIHLWGQGVSAELAFSVTKRYTGRVWSTLAPTSSGFANWNFNRSCYCDWIPEQQSCCLTVFFLICLFVCFIFFFSSRNYVWSSGSVTSVPSKTNIIWVKTANSHTAMPMYIKLY